MSSKLLKNPLLVIVLLIFISSLLRFHAFKSPVGESHVWLSTHVLLTSLIWESDAIASHHFSPIYTFSGTQDKHMRSLASGISDSHGNFYYVSYPPFSFLFAYFFFKLFFLSPSIEALQILNIFLQGVTAYAIYTILCSLYRKKTTTFFPPAIIGSAFYIFSTQSLWCHIYMYFADTLIQVLWAICVYLSFLTFQRGRIHSWKVLFCLGCVIFLAVYTEWLGLFFVCCLFPFSIYKGLRQKVYFRATLVITLSALLAILITLWQYSFIDGLSNLINASAEKYMDRSGISQNSLYLMKIDSLRLLNHYWRLHKANIILILFLGVAALSLIKYLKPRRSSDHLFLMAITICPIVIHHIVFLEFSSMHDFSTLKSLILICFVIGMLYNLITSIPLNSTNTLFVQRICAVLASTILILNVLLYYSKINFSPHTIFSVASHQINLTSTPDDALYSSTKNDRENGIMVYMGQERAFSTQIQFLTQRNILAISGTEEAISHMKSFQNKRGVLYIFDQYGRLTGIEFMAYKSK